MQLRSLLDNPAKLHRLGYITVWVQGILGGILLLQTWPALTHGIFACVLAAVLICVHVGARHRAARVTARVLVGSFWLVASLFVTQIILTVLSGWVYYAPDLRDDICFFCGEFLCYLVPAALAVMLYTGEHATGYDRALSVICQTALVPVAYLALFTDAGIPWTLNGAVLPYVWGIVVLFTTLVVWTCAKKLTPEQAAAVERRRLARQEKREARKSK